MAASPDDVADGEPFTPSAFLDLPPTPAPSPGEAAGEVDDPAAHPADLVLPVISRMLMEDTDEEDELLLNHPSLLQAQRPFAQILSGAATTPSPPRASDPAAFAGATWPYDPEELSGRLLLLSRTRPPGDRHGGALGSDFFSSSGQNRVDMGMLNAAFLKGMEEASKFLPPTNDNNLLLFHGKAKPPLFQERGNNVKGQKKWRSWEWDDYVLEADAGRKSKITAPEPEETGEAVDKLIVDGYDACMEKMKGLRISRIAEAEKNKLTKKGNKINNGSSSNEDVDLRTLLIRCAEAMSSTTGGTHEATAELLGQIRRRSSPAGDATQRLAHCFAEGLEARLAGSGGGQVYRSLVARPPSVVDYFEAYHLYLMACCFETMAYKFSGMAICDAVAGRKKKKKKVHIVDYGVGYGFQWPSLLAYMATWEGGPPEVRITGIDLPRPGFRPAARVEETGRRLRKYARELGVPFQFHGVVAEWETVRASDLRVDTDEVLVVNSITGLGNTMDEGADVDSPSPRDVVLGNIQKMRPDVFILCVVNGSYGGPFFLSRFREALSYYSAVFDMLDGAAPMDSSRRLAVERDLVGRRALNVIACEGSDRVERPEMYRQWQARNRRAGLRQLPLCPYIVKRLREKVTKYYHKEFVTDVDQQWLLQGWKGRILYAMSTWTADGTVS
ncbi:unnamed protein product [Urochloa decumbens]|uniref:Scarecrow-like protein 9 n=1 Tax=Urochloa decumbens TaxID=240449 RepID=A0ABC8ZV00_9POAL